jgi:hypothetical protein
MWSSLDVNTSTINVTIFDWNSCIFLFYSFCSFLYIQYTDQTNALNKIKYTYWNTNQDSITSTYIDTGVPSSFGFVILCVSRLHEDGTVVPKHVEAIIIMNCVLWCVHLLVNIQTVLFRHFPAIRLDTLKVRRQNCSSRRTGTPNDVWRNTYWYILHKSPEHTH